MQRVSLKVLIIRNKAGDALVKIRLHSALPEMCLTPGQMAVIKVLLPSLEVFDLGAEILSPAANTSAVLESN